MGPVGPHFAGRGRRTRPTLCAFGSLILTPMGQRPRKQGENNCTLKACDTTTEDLYNMPQSFCQIYVHLIFSTKDRTRNQNARHRNMTFKEEFRAFLDRYGIDYDEQYAWD